ncbi:hypothetical protein B0H12DRAFT_1240708 [Mycena haematopus]|nr:hypothetical protein B0H12DRAFT_1240708 [Mycena haematopus]
MGEQGAKVVVNYVNSAKAAEEVVASIKASGGSAVAVKADTSTIVGGQHLIDEAVKAFGRIDILVLNAGIMGSKVLADVDEASYDAHFATNVKGPLFLAKAAAPLLPAPVTSNTLVYTATKGAVEQISRILAKDLDTPLFREGKSQQLIDHVAQLAPSGRLGDVDDIAPVVSFLASPAAQWLNGQNVRVNGGYV